MSAKPPRVSVIVATYDRPQYLAEAVGSVLRGVYEDFEIIVSDDAGPPANRAAVEALHDCRVRYRRNTERLGSAGNHRAAARDARGEYVAMLNDDDTWEPELLATLTPLLDVHPVVAAFADHYIIDAQGRRDAAASIASSHRWRRDLLDAGIHHPFIKLAIIDQSFSWAAALLRRDAIAWNDCPAEIGPLYDLWLGYLASRGGGAAYYLPRRLASYRVHPQSETAAGGTRVGPAAVFIYDRFMTDPALAFWRPCFARRLRAAQVNYALVLLADGRAAEARRYLWAPLRSPAALRAGLAMGLSWMPGATGGVMLRMARTLRRRVRRVA